MGCSGGCGSGGGTLPAGCNNNGSCGTDDRCNKLSVFDWLGNMSLPNGQKAFDLVEVRFKNSRKEYYRNSSGLSLNVGDAVAVEANSGHDLGTVSLTGELVRLQLKKRNLKAEAEDIKKVYRKAKQSDIDKWHEARALETSTMYRARTIALSLGLEMKLSDVEYQGDKSKAVFYYTADARVDFRELIKVLAEEFRVRIEMRQIGARQEASRLGGIGSCGRELCCSTWLSDFRTVSTSAARYQQLSLNPLKLAGQCGKLKCCLNYELDSYSEALKEFPDLEGKKLNTKKGEAFLQKIDIFRKMMWFSYKSDPTVLIPMDIESVKLVLEANKKGEHPEELKPSLRVFDIPIQTEPVFANLVGEESLTRFDSKSKNNKGKRPQGHTKPQQNKSRNQQSAKQGSGSRQGQSPVPPKQSGGRHQSGKSGQQKPANSNPSQKPKGPHHNRSNPPRHDQKPNTRNKPDQ
ncbi:MAG TPA: regulatory iron-sulfur-containing complex subunit RicT [Bacteroidia bacterium]|nr:regulatory iron-sulfur-containing complex subunit RicT [Bacteroidia bacterium]